MELGRWRRGAEAAARAAMAWLKRQGSFSGRGVNGRGVNGRGVTGALGRIALLPALAPLAGRVEAGVPRGGIFSAGSYTHAAGARGYRLFVPDNFRDRGALVVMLHGCGQSAEDFAAGTRMNALAVAHGFAVLYPEQETGASSRRCWNWFRPEHQHRESGEPAIIAGMTRQVMAACRIDPARVFVAGLSAGGAAAAVLGATYPDLFAAVGIQSGLPYGAARDMPTALWSMLHGRRGRELEDARVPLILFHGDHDRTVHPNNLQALEQQWTHGRGLAMHIENGAAPAGRPWTRRTFSDSNGKARVESWLVHGGLHGWSGGSADGSFTDPPGPDASSEMIRFFFGAPHPKRGRKQDVAPVQEELVHS